MKANMANPTRRTISGFKLRRNSSKGLLFIIPDNFYECFASLDQPLSNHLKIRILGNKSKCLEQIRLKAQMEIYAN